MTAKRGTKATRPNGDGARSRPTFVPPRGAHQRTDDGNAFMPDPEDGPARIDDDLAENLAEDFLQAATSGEDQDGTHGMVPEEIGGPFIETTGEDEFAAGTDDSNPDDATAEPMPRAVGGLAQGPRGGG